MYLPNITSERDSKNEEEHPERYEEHGRCENGANTQNQTDEVDDIVDDRADRTDLSIDDVDKLESGVLKIDGYHHINWPRYTEVSTLS
jgi:hypothetical protein